MGPSSPGYAQAYQKAIYGFATGGMIQPGDSQKVEFFKNPNERVIVARPDQFEDRRSETSRPTSRSSDQRPIQQTFNVRIEAAGGNVSKDSLAAVRTQFALIGRDMLRAINGR